MYDTPRAALNALTDDALLERVAVRVMRLRYPELRITGPSGDLHRDGFKRALFGDRDEIVLLVSCEKPGWTRKLRKDLKPYGAMAVSDRPGKAIFVTTCSTRQVTQQRYKDQVRESLGIALEIVDVNELALELQSDELQQVAEDELAVRPRLPRSLQSTAVFREARRRSMPGEDSPMAGREDELRVLRGLLAASGDQAPRIVVVEGPGGIGKTRLALEAADSGALTLVAGAGTALAAGSLYGVPTGEASVLIVDDAHRSPDLSGIAVLLGDQRFARVKIVVTVRPGFTANVLARVGQDRAGAPAISLVGLNRGEIDKIVTGYGITSEPFRRHVADIAVGNPLFAHTACQVASSQPSYRWSDSARLLRELVDDRLQHIEGARDAHRAVAVALAVMTTVRDARQLADLAGAVTALPVEADRLDVMLEDLAEAGIAVGPPYTISPDAAAAVITATALDPQSRVKIKPVPLLAGLGRSASWTTQGDRVPGTTGLLGVSLSSPAEAVYGLNLNAALLAAQLSVLTQAAHLAGDDHLLGMQRHAVLELAGRADVVGWHDVLVLAGAVAPLVPRLIGQLHETLIGQWPVAPTAVAWMDEDPERHYRLDTELLIKQAISLGVQASRPDPGRAVRWMLDCAWLSYPVLGQASCDLAEHAIRSTIGAVVPGPALSWDEVLRQRQQVFTAVACWGRDRHAAPPAGLPPQDRAARGPSVTAGILLAALIPFLDVVIEEHTFGTPADARAFVWRHYILPDDPQAMAGIVSAANAVSELFIQLDLHSPQAGPLLQAVIRLPGKLRGAGARGLGHQQPMPDYGIQVLNNAARLVGDTVASRWEELPLTARYDAARSAVRPRGRAGSTLADLAGQGDPVAVAVAADSELGRFLTISPVDYNQYTLSDPGRVTDHYEENRSRAAGLAEQLTADEALDLMEQAGPAAGTMSQADGVWEFARAVGRRAPDATEILARLPESTHPFATAVLAGVLETHPQETSDWLAANIGIPRIAGFALPVADELPAGKELPLLQAITDKTTGNEPKPTDAHNLTAPGPGPKLAPGSEGEPATERDTATVAVAVAAHLGHCRASPRRTAGSAGIAGNQRPGRCPVAHPRHGRPDPAIRPSTRDPIRRGPPGSSPGTDRDPPARPWPC